MYSSSKSFLHRIGTATMLWILAIVDSAGFADNYFACNIGNVSWLYLSIATTVVTTITLPVLIWRLHLRGHHHGAFAATGPHEYLKKGALINII